MMNISQTRWKMPIFSFRANSIPHGHFSLKICHKCLNKTSKTRKICNKHNIISNIYIRYYIWWVGFFQKNSVWKSSSGRFRNFNFPDILGTGVVSLRKQHILLLMGNKEWSDFDSVGDLISVISLIRGPNGWNLELKLITGTDSQN